jgi:hypothetical protein
LIPNKAQARYFAGELGPNTGISTAHVAAAVMPPSATSSKTSSGVPVGVSRFVLSLELKFSYVLPHARRSDAGLL